jgi:hypothetical protein
MTHACCPSCRLRFTPAAAAYLEACPTCGKPPQPVDRAEQTLGFRLVTQADLIDALPAAAVVALPVPSPPGGPRDR